MSAIFTPKVMVVMPRYGMVYPEPMISKMVPSSWNVPAEDRVQLVAQADASSSLLPHAFNEVLKEAYRMRDSGQLTHLAMIHADIAPEGYWLNQLWRLMRDRGDVAISAVVPIKDHWTDTSYAGRTSTAFSPRHDPYIVSRYIRMADRQKMIDAGLETFGPKDVCEEGEVLLINSGLMLLDLRHPCWDVPAYEGEGNVFSFAFRTRICKDLKGEYSTWVRSEDWEMSRHLDRCGAPYSSTWSIRLKHFGHDYWPSYPETPEPAVEGFPA